MNILILGSGGREHTIAWKIKQSPQLSKLFVAPGNAGTAAIGKNLPFSATDFEAVKKAVLENQIEMVIVGPEDPLVKGIHDYFLENEKLREISVIGPQKAAAALEGSKEFAKNFMAKHNIPTAEYKSFTPEKIEEAYTFLETLSSPYVLKADGLAAGKGVLILEDLNEAKEELKKMLLESKFGEASSKVVIEEFLKGIELSCFVLTDGDSYKILPYAKDYKRIGEGDTGLNTGGMGAISPVPFADEAFLKKVEDRIVIPTVNGLKEDNLPYQGFIFIGLIKVGDEPLVIEYNVRLGDPETEVIVPRIQNDFVTLFKAVADQKLDTVNLAIEERSATTVMAVSGGYPETYEKGKEITGLSDVENTLVFHAGTKLEENRILTNGGRVMAFTSFGTTFQEALQQSYTNLKKVHFEAINYRRDIGFDL